MLTGSGAGRQTINFSERRAVASPSIIPEHRPSHCQSSILIPPWEGSAANSSMSRSFRAAPAFCPLRFLDNLPHTLMKHI
jgi:hypothetical protein